MKFYAKFYMKIENQESIDHMQHDLNAMVKWCSQWRLTLNTGKCHHVQYNPRSAIRSYHPRYMLCGTQINQREQVKDLGMIISEDLKTHNQVSQACQRAHREIDRIRCSFISRSPAFISGMYKTFVRPHLEYCIEVWNPSFQGDINKMEKVQNKMSRLIQNGHLKTAEERNEALGITSHQKRRLRGDLINIYKNINDRNLFQLRNNDRMRGHNLTICIPRSNCTVKSHSFSMRSVKEWNKLPQFVVNSVSLNSFKRNIDMHLSNS